jgi:hypothetical protein
MGQRTSETETERKEKSMKIKIGDCNENDAFLTNEDGFDVACLSRYTPTSHGVGSDEHIAHLLTDKQWQELINSIDAHDELVAMLRKCRDAFAANDAAYMRYINSDDEELPNLESLAEELDVVLYKIERGHQ